ncbi:MAG TPA: glycogen debranching protein GlgX [Ramlibacter sp.]|uniref:glycogen debranching protein GlgX n=1 Tax=Ramlibacter sp. TaxID=1917967 RepID=UPI002BDD1328|nr:glycogen debranching protein GlgX [Ramlibacter sp.]HVZ43745.1 glycogen debranching protein GlgX [Ramlibacter sp.]
MTASAVVETKPQGSLATPAAPPAPPPLTIEAGQAWPLGATPREGGVNFAVWSSSAESIELCLFDAEGTREVNRVALPACTHGVWHGFVPGIGPGTRYGLRAHGPYDPLAGQRFNANKVLLDPYARALDRPLRGAAWQYAYKLGNPEQDRRLDATDNAPHAAKCVVVDGSFDWEDDAPPRTPWEDTVFYEVHVRGFTQQMPDVPQPLRGTYAGFASEAAIAHLQRLGVTAVELLPVHAFNDERRLVDLGLANYWGYNSIAFFAPDPRYCATGDAVTEFRQMVRALHRAGIEVILDVVFNHSCEGNHLGPTLCFKGLDNRGYYRLAEDNRYYLDFTGTGNTIDSSKHGVLRTIMDSLRYWVEEMHVDGFRFDLAPAVSRNPLGSFDHFSPFLCAVAQDPVLARVKLVAEPWDIGDNGYQVGGFPRAWSEWNGRYRDCVRDFWRGSEGSLPEFAARLAGSQDIYAPSGRKACASVNVITVHDGFTLADLVSYNDKHNEANAEDNRDGESHNRSWNCGAEGPTEDYEVIGLRERQKRNFLTTLFASRGVPLLLGGDEMSRTQGGNNNAYCQDNAVSWFDWSEARRSDPLLEFTRAVIALRRELPVLRVDAWLTGEPDAQDRRDAAWYSVWGLPMTEEEWTNPAVRCVAMMLDGRFVPERCGGPGVSAMLVFNATAEEVTFTLPEVPGHEGEWRLRVYTAEGHFDSESARRYAAQAKLELVSHSMALLTQCVCRGPT